MSNYDNTNRGAIWKNDKKETDRHPDFKGSLDVDGVDYWVSAWKRKEGDSPNSPALRFSVQPKESSNSRPQTSNQPQSQGGTSSTQGGGGVNDFDDDLDF